MMHHPFLALRLALFYASSFLVVGILMPFWPLWLTARGLDAAEIGLLLAAGSALRAFTNPLVAQLADRHGRLDRMLVALGWATLAVYFLYLPAYGFWAIFAVTAISHLVFSPMVPLADAVTMLKVREGVVDYGRVRLWGSLTFILAATAGGVILEGRSPELVLWMIIALLGVTVAACHLMPRAETPGTARFSTPLQEILRDRALLAFMVTAGILQASHGVYYGFATLHWREAGLGAGVIGALWAEGVVAEVALFAMSGRILRRFDPVALLLLAAAAGVARWSVLGLTDALPLLVAAQLLHAFTFGAAHVAAMHYIARAVPASCAATAQSVYSSTALGCILAASMLASGWLFEAFGGFAFLAMAAVSLAGGMAAAALRTRMRPLAAG